MDAAELTQFSGKERSLWAKSFSRLLRNKVAVISGIFIIVLVLAAIFADYLTPYTFAEQDLLNNNAVPEWMMFLLPEGGENYARISNDYPLSADNLGRDIWTRTIFGARISLIIAFAAATVDLLVGIIIGMISGYAGGRTDSIIMRVVDFLYAFPFLIAVILLQTYFKAIGRRGGAEGIGNLIINLNNQMGGLLFLFIAIGLLNWLQMARLARGQVLATKKMEYVEAARALGANDTRIMVKHLFPNILGPLIVAETLAIPGYIFLEAFLSFIGLGVRSYPNQVLIPAIALSLTTLAFNFLGDGLRDAFDPRQKEV